MIKILRRRIDNDLLNANAEDRSAISERDTLDSSTFPDSVITRNLRTQRQHYIWRRLDRKSETNEELVERRACLKTGYKAKATVLKI